MRLYLDRDWAAELNKPVRVVARVRVRLGVIEKLDLKKHAVKAIKDAIV
jgi:hypothetical protein